MVSGAAKEKALKARYNQAKREYHKAKELGNSEEQEHLKRKIRDLKNLLRKNVQTQAQAPVEERLATVVTVGESSNDTVVPAAPPSSDDVGLVYDTRMTEHAPLEDPTAITLLPLDPNPMQDPTAKQQQPQKRKRSQLPEVLCQPWYAFSLTLTLTLEWTVYPNTS